MWYNCIRAGYSIKGKSLKKVALKKDQIWDFLQIAVVFIKRRLATASKLVTLVELVKSTLKDLGPHSFPNPHKNLTELRLVVYLLRNLHQHCCWCICVLCHPDLMKI